MAVMKSNAEVVTTLLEFGADPKIKDTVDLHMHHEIMLYCHTTFQNRVTAVDIAAKTFFPKRIYRILLDATGLTEQEYKVYTGLTLFIVVNLSPTIYRHRAKGVQEELSSV